VSLAFVVMRIRSDTLLPGAAETLLRIPHPYEDEDPARLTRTDYRRVWELTAALVAVAAARVLDAAALRPTRMPPAQAAAVGVRFALAAVALGLVAARNAMPPGGYEATGCCTVMSVPMFFFFFFFFPSASQSIRRCPLACHLIL
jgi:hypothetical protein